jgi:hypothetical protein
MPIPSLDQTVADLGPYFDSIREFSQKAWDYYHGELPPLAQMIFGSRSRANNVHDLMVYFASEFVAENADCARSFERQQMRGVVLLDKYAIRLKKIDEGNRSRNQPSTQVSSFREQIELDGIGAIHHLELGYILDKWQREIVDVRLVCPSGEGFAWAVSVLGNQEVVATETNIFEIAPTEESSVEEVVPAEIEAKPREADILPFVRKDSSAD